MAYKPPSTAGSVTITGSYSGDSSHLASSGTSSLTVDVAHTLSIAKRSSGLVVFDPLNNVTRNQSQIQSQHRYWTYAGDAQAQNAPYAINEDQQGLHIAVQAKSQGTYAGFFAEAPNVLGELFHAVITAPARTIPSGDYNAGLYVQTGSGFINYVFCAEDKSPAGTAWGVSMATGNSTQATTVTTLEFDTSPNQPLTRSCTILTNGVNYLAVYVDDLLVYNSTQLSLQMASPFQAYLEVQSCYADQMLYGTFTDFYASRSSNVTVTNLPTSASTVQLVDQSGNILASSTVSNGVAALDIGGHTFPVSAGIVVKSADGSTVVSSSIVYLVGGDTYGVVYS